MTPCSVSILFSLDNLSDHPRSYFHTVVWTESGECGEGSCAILCVSRVIRTVPLKLGKGTILLSFECKEQRANGKRRRAGLCCTGPIRPAQHSFKLQKERFLVQEGTALLGSFPPWGYKICSLAPTRQSQLQRQSLALEGCSHGRRAFGEFAVTLRRKQEPTFSQFCCTFCPARPKYNFGP